ncbi:hypothetical protein KI387_013969, partial [Taxus chinensis]
MPQRNAVSWSATIAGYAQNGFVEKACELFGRMPQRNVLSWNAMIVGYAHNGFIVHMAFVCYPKHTDKPLYHGLVTQLEALAVPFLPLEDFPIELATDFVIIVDAIFG